MKNIKNNNGKYKTSKKIINVLKFYLTYSNKMYKITCNKIILEILDHCFNQNKIKKTILKFTISSNNIAKSSDFSILLCSTNQIVEFF